MAEGLNHLMGGDGSSSLSQGRLPPHHLEAERSVLGAILVQNDTIDLVREVGLEHTDFYLDSHQKIFEACCALSDRGEPIDLVTLTSVLKDRQWFDSVGGTTTLAGLFDDAFAVGNVLHYGRIIREKAILRRMIETCSGIISNAYSGQENIENFIDEAETRIFKVSDHKGAKAFTELKSIMMSNMKTIEDLSIRDTEVTGLPTGFEAFDRLTTGLHPGQVMILAARPGMGKTSWFLSVLQQNTKHVAALFSLEMSEEEIGFRSLSQLSRMDTKKLKTGRLEEKDWGRLAQAADQLARSKIFVDDSGGLTVMDIRTRCRRLKAKEKRLDLIIIDYLQLMRGSKAARGEGSREREISEISRNLKELAKELKVPVIACSQLNRGVESRQDKRPNLSDIRESGAIEQDADIVCFLHREDYYDRDAENKGIAELIVSKNRSGPTDTIRLAWLPQYTLFANLAPDSPGTPVRPSRPHRGDITL